MKEIKLWTLERDNTGSLVAKSVNTTDHAETEKQLEDLLVRSPDLLMQNLTLIGRQTPAGGGALDLLGVNEDGNLVVFELKRGILSRDAIAQVLDYAAYLSNIDSDQLIVHISERSGSSGIEKIENFDGWYQERFPNNPDGYSNRPSMVLVGLGADERTRRMVDFLSEGGLDISLITFQAFVKDDKMFLARQVDRATERVTQPRYTKSENLEALKELSERIDVDELLRNMATFFRRELPSYEWPSRSGYSYSLIEKTEKGTPSYRVYVSIYISEAHPGVVQLVFQNRAVQAAKEEFEKFFTEHDNRFEKAHGNYQTWIKSDADWNNLSESIQPILQSMIKGWQAKSQEEDSQTFLEENT